MPNTQSCTPTTKPDNVSMMLKALGHPSRVDIVRQLALRDRCCAGDFCCCLSLAQSTISQHLEMLCEAGLVEREPCGTKSIFTLNKTAFDQLATTISEFSKPISVK